MKENEEKLLEILKVLDDADVIGDVVVIGSWSLFFYQYIFEQFNSTFRTMDVDIYIPNPKKIKCAKLLDKFRVISLISTNDILTNKTYLVSSDGFEVELLTGLDRTNSSCIKIGDTGIYAESLPYLDIFNQNYISVNYYGINLKVASPEAYVLQKLLIINKRSYKLEKDLDALKNVVLLIESSQKYIITFRELYQSLPKKWKKKILDNSKEFDIEINYIIL